MTVKLGQKLWFVPTGRSYAAREITIEKVGRRWAYFDNGSKRCDVATLVVDAHGYAAPGALFESEEIYKANISREIAFSSLRQRLGYRPEQGVSEQDIRQAARLLGISLDGSPS
jgi:hypothetical protein